MQLTIYKDYPSLSAGVADLILETVKNNPRAVLCLATGDTPLLAYQLLAEKATNEKVDFTNCTFIALDEWVGIPPGNKGSCNYFLETHVLQPLHFSPDRIYLFDVLSNDMAAECKKMDEAIASSGAIDLLLAGVGLNGHLGFNEPGVSPDNFAHVANLDEITQSVGQKYFTGPVKITQGITLGLKHILKSKQLLLMANGIKKSAIIKKVLEGETNMDTPAAMIRTHANSMVLIDEEAASALSANRSVV